MEELKEVRAKKFTGIEKTVIVKPIIRLNSNGLVTDVKHEAAFLFGTATNTYCLPMDRQGNLNNPFTSKEEQEWLEEELDADLNIHKIKDNYWKKLRVRLGKEPRKLNLKNPKDYVEWLVLKANPMFIAPSGEEALNKSTYKYSLQDENFSAKEVTKEADLNMEAYMLFGKMADDKEKMINFLKVFGKRVAKGSKELFLKTEISKIIKEDVEAFLAVARDSENYEYRLLIAEAVEYGIIIKKGREYLLQGGDTLSNPSEPATLDNAVKYLKLPVNQDITDAIRARVEAARD